jgi:deoxyadenosine/deoxycytidine kinase
MNIVIGGNISSGKTTQLNFLESLGCKVKREPIEKWPLELYYKDEERWGFLFQMIVLQTLEKVNYDCIYESCPYSSKNVFWPLMKKTKEEDIAYRDAYKYYGWKPDLYILIDKTPELCYEHLLQRHQSGDSGVTLEYLEKLHKKYQELFEKLDCKKFKINGNQPINKVNLEIVKIIKENCSSIIKKND